MTQAPGRRRGFLNRIFSETDRLELFFFKSFRLVCPLQQIIFCCR